MTTSSVQEAVLSVQTVSDQILSAIEAADPAVALPAETAATILNLLAQLTTAALTALTTAQSEVISAASISALDPDPTPLTPPDPAPEPEAAKKETTAAKVELVPAAGIDG